MVDFLTLKGSCFCEPISLIQGWQTCVTEICSYETVEVRITLYINVHIDFLCEKNFVLHEHREDK